MSKRSTLSECLYDPCDQPVVARGYCQAHYRQKYTYGIELRPIRLFRKRGEPIPEEKMCGLCNEVKPADQFSFADKEHRYLDRYCKPCKTIIAREGRLKRGLESLRESGREYDRTHRAERNAQANLRRARQMGASICENVNRLVVADRDGWICQLCFDPIDPNTPHKLENGQNNPWYLHIDHVIPLSRGGDHSYANVQASHATCNLRKHNSLPEE